MSMLSKMCDHSTVGQYTAVWHYSQCCPCVSHGLLHSNSLLSPPHLANSPFDPLWKNSILCLYIPLRDRLIDYQAGLSGYPSGKLGAYRNPSVSISRLTYKIMAIFLGPFIDLINYHWILFLIVWELNKLWKKGYWSWPNQSYWIW